MCLHLYRVRLNPSESHFGLKVGKRGLHYDFLVMLGCQLTRKLVHCIMYQYLKYFPCSPQKLTEYCIFSSTPREGKTPVYVDFSYKAFYLVYLIHNF